METSARAKLLNEGIEITTKDREDIYGPPHVNLSCQGELLAIYNRYCSPEKYSPGHQAAISSIFQKLGRIATGKFHKDNYIDGLNYFAIAYECEAKHLNPTPLLGSTEQDAINKFR